MNKILFYLRWLIAPFIILIGVMGGYFIGGILLAFIGKLYSPGTPIWWENIINTGFQSALLAFLSFWITQKVVPNYKKRSGIIVLVLFGLILIGLSILVIRLVIINHGTYTGELSYKLFSPSTNGWLTIFEQFVQIIAYLISAKLVYDEFIH